MKLIKHFDSFLKNKVNLRDSRIEQLDSRVSAVEKFLSSGDDVIAEHFVDLIPQGSYAQRTIINPVGANDEFDADVLLDIEEVDGWDAEDYVQELYTVLRSSSTYRDKVSRRSRCVVIDYANEFHMDVVPFLTRHDERYITNRNENTYELTNPEGFNEWLEEQDRLAGGRLVKVIRLFKYLRDYKNNFSAKSVILTILLGGRISDDAIWADSGHYSDLPTAFKNIVNDLNDYLQAHATMPNLDDPSCPTENFNHRWDQDEYANFRTWVKIYSGWITDAFDEVDRDESLRKWRKLFGDDFGTYAEVTKATEAHVGRSGVTDTEENITVRWGIPIRLDPRHRVKLVGRLQRKVGFRHYDLPTRGNVVGRNRIIDFRVAHNTVPEPFDVYWKVRNTGEEAIQANAIRGQVVPDKGGISRSEPTAYVGKHYVEVYIVKGGVCIAMDHHPVIIK
ncbi:nucleotidyltransferase [Rathayibacter sp. AY1C6]|uniref:SMODS domain-containing nucleotidyltransferase n=1 Tax=Rathayibacter sp. AY1C6 TaxID=2080539 RepID=UPI000CE9228A|nr:nucleotidyltransferase [Rathayibacter sp. AY1C6]PPG15139.1 nucleotidyltransferase [Rathayibacter sp. AY1C6]